MINNKINRWWTVAGGALACAVSIGVVGNSFGIFTKAIADEFGWARSTATLGLTIQHIFSGLSFAPLGAILLRWGVRLPTAILVIICSICIFCLGLVPNSAPIYYVLFAIMGAASAAATAMPYSVAIVKWFDEYRGVALGLMVMGTGIGASIVPLYTNYLLSTYGWRIGFMALAVTLLSGSLLALAFMVRTPGSKSFDDENSADPVQISTVPSYVEILTRLPRFWLVGAPVFLLSVVVAGILLNIVPIMTDAGYTTSQAVGMLSAAGIASISSRVLVGFCLDRILAPYVGAGVLLVATLGLLIILFGPTWLPAAYAAALITVISQQGAAGAHDEDLLGTIKVYGNLVKASDITVDNMSVCIGFSLGAEADIITFMVSRYFRPEVYSKVVGTMFLLFAWGNATGISVASYAHDYVGSYRSAIALFVALNIISLATILRLGEYPYSSKSKSHPVSKTEEANAIQAQVTVP
jgi:MFS family permease